MFQGLNFLSPWTAAAAGALALPALVLLYFLKLRRKRVVVSSTLLWRKAVYDMQVNAPFQKLRRNLLLLLQLLLLLLLLLAMARPVQEGQAAQGDRFVVVIDHSGSMNATDVSPSRLAEAKHVALREIEKFTGGGGVMVMAFAESPRVMCSFTNDKAEARAAVEAIEPTDQKSNLASAIELIEPYASGRVGQGAVGVLVLSDGRFTGEEPVALPGARVQYLRLGNLHMEAEPDNLAIVSMSARRDFRQPQMVEIYAEVANYSTAERLVNVTLTVEGEGDEPQGITVPGVRRVEGETGLGEPGRKGVRFRPFALAQGALIGLRLDVEDDLEADNQAYVALPPPQRLRVLLVSEEPMPVKPALEAVGLEKVEHITPSQYEQRDPSTLIRSPDDEDAGFEAIVFEGYSPKSLPPVDALYLGCAPPVERLRLIDGGQQQSGRFLLDWRRDDPILRHVALDDVVVWDAARLAVPDDAQVLAMGVDGPVMAYLVRQGMQQIVVGFDVKRTGWPLHVSFPVFFQNAVRVLALGRRASEQIRFEPGEVAVVRQIGAGIEEVVYDGPVTLRAPVEQRRAVLPVFEQAGLYYAEQDVPAGWEAIPVNMLSAEESDTRAVALTDAKGLPAQTTAAATFRVELWWWLVLGALGMLAIEWLVYTRRMGM